MDEQIGRVVQAFEKSAPGQAVVILVGDHGEGLGDHGEALHGNLVYQSTMHVPLVVAGSGVTAGVNDTPVSTRRVFHTILDFAGLASEHSLRRPDGEVVLGEGMKPFLEYGWQPQVMAVEGVRKAILSGKVEAYDLDRDPGEGSDLGSGVNLSSTLRARLEEYPVPSPEAARAPDTLDDEAKRRLASLGYVSAGAAPIVRRDAPRPADMTALFGDLERASAPDHVTGNLNGRVHRSRALNVRDMKVHGVATAARDHIEPVRQAIHFDRVTPDVVPIELHHAGYRLEIRAVIALRRRNDHRVVLPARSAEIRGRGNFQYVTVPLMVVEDARVGDAGRP